jgi:Holliday junction DNA helicase RuvA
VPFNAIFFLQDSVPSCWKWWGENPLRHSRENGNPDYFSRGYSLDPRFSGDDDKRYQALAFTHSLRQNTNMIAKLSGLLDDFGDDWAIIDVQGVGYLVHCSAKTLSALGERGEACTVHTDLQVSENDMRLLGFAESAERDWFRLLTQVQGVGSKVALAILSALSTGEVRDACAGGDAAMVARAQGVGPKLAGRIVNELKDKAGALPGGGVAGTSAAPVGGASADAVSALENLGFKPAVAARAVSSAQAELGEGANEGDLIRVALKKAAG